MPRIAPAQPPLGMARNNRSSRQRRSLHKGLEYVGVDRNGEPHSSRYWREVKVSHSEMRQIRGERDGHGWREA